MLCFLYFFLRFPSFITIVFIFYLVVIFPSQTRIRVNIKVVRCLKYSASLVSTQSVLRRNSDNMSSLGINTSINIRRTLIIMLTSRPSSLVYLYAFACVGTEDWA